MLENLLHSDHSALWKSLATVIPEYAKSSGLVQRVSAKFSPAAFLLTLLSAATTGKASLNALAISLCGNSKGKTSGFKVNLAFDLLTGSIISNEKKASWRQPRHPRGTQRSAEHAYRSISASGESRV